MSIFQLLNDAKAQNRDMREFEGIIFYRDTDSIPEEVFLIPAHLKSDEDFNEFVATTFSNFKDTVINIYFQCMRWTMPNMLENVKMMKYTKGYLKRNSDLVENLRISACKIYTDASQAHLLTEYYDQRRNIGKL